jgi:hypothetical protein
MSHGIIRLVLLEQRKKIKTEYIQVSVHSVYVSLGMDVPDVVKSVTSATNHSLDLWSSSGDWTKEGTVWTRREESSAVFHVASVVKSVKSHLEVRSTEPRSRLPEQPLRLVHHAVRALAALQ